MVEIAKLDLKDRKILAELDWNARISNTELARKVGLSKKSVEYRIKQLENKKVIVRYYPMIHFNRLGYHVRRVDLILQNANPSLKKEIETYIISDPDMDWALWSRGEAELCIDVMARSSTHFKEVFNRFNTRFGKYIKERRFSNTIGFEQYPMSIILGKNRKEEVVMRDEEERVEIDKLDKDILNELAKNARQSSSEIAEKVKSNYKTVGYRIKNLEEKGILVGTRALIDNRKLGYNYYKLVMYFNHYSDEQYEKMKEYFKKMMETTYIVYHVDSDFDAEVMFPSDNDFFSFLDKLNEDFPGLIKEMRYRIFVETIKISYIPVIKYH